jgi:tRNA-splicing endonuclease subunit Sen54
MTPWLEANELDSANKTLMPTLDEITALFSQIPESGPPQPRKKPLLPSQGAPKGPISKPSPASTQAVSRAREPWYYTLIPPFLVPLPKKPLPRTMHPFAILKAGKKNVVIAAVDNGNISFFRFSQGAFHEMPVV